MGDLLDIAEVRARTGLSVAALHHYESLGLIRSSARAGLRRQYEPETLQRLGTVVRCQRAGFRLEEVGQLLSARDEVVVRGLLQSRRAELRSQIRELREAERDLTLALRCSQPLPSECEQLHRQASGAIPVTPRRRRRRDVDGLLDR